MEIRQESVAGLDGFEPLTCGLGNQGAAALGGCESAVPALLEARADVNAKNKEGETVLTLSAGRGVPGHVRGDSPPVSIATYFGWGTIRR